MDTNLNAFRKGWRRIDETSMNRIMSHGKYGFIIVSASRSEIYSDNPNNDLTPEYEEWCQKEGREIEDSANMDFWLNKRNKSEDEKLLSELRDSKYAYSKVCGGYKGTDGVTDNFEPSFIVYCHAKEDTKAYLNFDELFKFGLEIAKRYKQDSIYVQKPNEAPIYVNSEGVKVNARESKDFIFNDYTQQYYTTIKRKKRATQDYKDKNGKARLETPPQRFTADIQFESLYRKAGPSTLNERMKRQKEGEVFLDR